jgi:hypothetical protein
LKQLAQDIYTNKARIWSWQIKSESPQLMNSLTEATKQQLNRLTNFYKTIDNLTNKSLDEHIIPKFTIDVQNLKVVKARDQVWSAIEEGDKSKAEYFFAQGKMPLYNGATLDVQRMVPDLSAINWSMKSWLNEQERLVDKYNREVSSADIRSMQLELKRLGIYDGAETGKYDDFLGDVTYFQQLIPLEAVDPAPSQAIAIAK